MAEMNGKKAGFSKQEKHSIMSRLLREGRWSEAREFKETIRQSGESNDVAYAAMLEKYPPLDLDEDDNGPSCIDEPGPTPEEKKELDKLITGFEGQKVDLQADFEWAYLHSNDLNLSPKDAPTPGAWSWYRFSKANPAKFMDISLKQFKPKEENDKENWKVDDGRILKVIEKLKRSYKAREQPE